MTRSKKYLLLLFLFPAILMVVFYSTAFAEQIHIRLAKAQELPAVLVLDERVTYEFFKPLYASIYQYLKVNRDVDQDLQEELAADAERFPKLINNDGAERLHIAWDLENDRPCGLLVFSQDDNNELLLDLLLVDKNYRGMGIGKKLVQSVFQVFKATRVVNVYPIQFNNESTLKFYEALGFKNLGVGSEDKINSHGIRHSDVYYHFRLER